VCEKRQNYVEKINGRPPYVESAKKKALSDRSSKRGGSMSGKGQHQGRRWATLVPYCKSGNGRSQEKEVFAKGMKRAQARLKGKEIALSRKSGVEKKKEKDHVEKGGEVGGRTRGGLIKPFFQLSRKIYPF